MERRKEPRLRLKQPVILTLLEAKSRRFIEACVTDISGGGVQLRVPMPLPCGATIEIEGGNTLILGEVCRCEPADGAYTVGVQVSQTLPSLMEVELLNRSLIGEEKAPKVESDSESRILRR
jgi:PilZ domain